MYRRPILLIEDDVADGIMVQRALRKNDIVNPVQWVRDGDEAIDYLTRTDSMSEVPPKPPLSIVLDLKLHGLSGFEFLEWLSQHPEFRNFPILVLSGSDFSDDKRRALSMGATRFLVKSIDHHELDDLVEVIKEHWTRSNVPKE